MFRAKVSTWLYFNFSVFLLGTELIATLRKKDVLIFKELFADNTQNKYQFKLESQYLSRLMQHYGRNYAQDEPVFKFGDLSHHLYYLVSGQVQLVRYGKIIRTIEAGEYFGEMALLSNLPAIADAIVTSAQADIVLIAHDNIETLLLDEPKVAMQFLRQMATRLQMYSDTNAS